MLFRHCGVHQDAFDVLLGQGDRTAIYPIVIGCRGCHQWYFADPAGMADWAETDGVLFEAEQQLTDECPDHPHWFALRRPASPGPV